MKNIKMLFASLAVIAVVGGSLAFKAAKFSTIFIYQKNAAGTACPVLPAQYDLSPAGAQFKSAFTSTTSTLSVPLSSCTSTYFATPE